jgi:hypothetical protein
MTDMTLDLAVTSGEREALEARIDEVDAATAARHVT